MPNCGGAHSWKKCDSPNRRCPNCKENHSASNTACPLHKRGLEIVKIKTLSNITYVEACRKLRSTANQIVPDRSSNDEFPSLPVGCGYGVLSQTTQPVAILRGGLGGLWHPQIFAWTPVFFLSSHSSSFGWHSLHSRWRSASNILNINLETLWPAFLSGPPLEHFYPRLHRHNSPANSVRGLYKSSTDWASFLVSIKKKLFYLG